jgi:ProP effector
MNDTSIESAAQAPKLRQPGRPPHQILERLFQLYPKLFGARFLPLKLGVFHELMALHPGEFTKDELKAALGVHARSTRYLESVASGAKRHDLNAAPVEDVAPEHVHHAIMEVFRRRQARSKEDLQPWLRARLVTAIEASGLGRAEYTQRVATHEPAALAALDEAFAELAQQAARREALKRAFATSGKSIDAFAEMYGMALAEVRRALEEPARPA